MPRYVRAERVKGPTVSVDMELMKVSMERMEELAKTLPAVAGMNEFRDQWVTLNEAARDLMRMVIKMEDSIRENNE